MAGCPHSTAPGVTASACSQCAGAVARVVRADGRGGLLIDGRPTARRYDLGDSPKITAQRMRGSAASGRAKRKR